MKRNIIGVALLSASLLVLVGCKSGAEKKGDEFLAKNAFKNAMMQYNKVDTKGNGSEQFNDNYALTMVRLMMQSVQKSGIEQDIINTYCETIPKKLVSSTNPEVLKEATQAFADLAKLRFAMDSYQQKLEAWRLLDTATVMGKRGGIGSDIPDKMRKELGEPWAKAAIAEWGKANPSDGGVVNEYRLLEIQRLLPNDASVQEALDNVRKINRHHFLIWSDAVNQVTPDPLIEGIYSGDFVMAFRVGEFNASATSLSGAVQIWNSSGNNQLLKSEYLTLVNKEGKEVVNSAPISAACQQTKNEMFKSVTPGLEPGVECTTQVSFSFGSDFKPEYMQMKIKNDLGRKYLAL